MLAAVPGGTAAQALAAARALHERTGRTAGNGSLMRTAPVALAFLGDPGALTHHDPEAGEACVLWCHAIRHAVLGAAHGASAVPARWQRALHGWPGLRSADLIALASAIAAGSGGG